MVVVTGKDAEIILDEMKNGTPNTPERIETIRRADEIFRRFAPIVYGKNTMVS